MASTRTIKVFYSYAPADKYLQQQLETHLSSLNRQGFIAESHGYNISAGVEWESETEAYLNNAHIILLLISPDFIASNYCYSTQMKRAMERHKAGEARIIPVILRPTDWENVPFQKLQCLPTNSKPVTRWKNRDAAFLDIALGIRRVVEELNTKFANHSSLFSEVDSSTAISSQLWNVPYHRNLFFTGRESIIKQLRSKLITAKIAALTQVQAISGLGGIGKTQLAIEYCYRYRKEYRATLWVRAATRDAIIADFQAIAALLLLPEQNDQDQNIMVGSVKRWLSNNEKWLLIMDNADDLDRVYDFLPIGGKGHILLTTRTQAVNTIANKIDVEEMSLDEGILLLLRRAKILAPDASLARANAEEKYAAEKIVVAMDGLPLALDHAGAYIEATQCGLTQYMELYQKHRKELLEWRGGVSHVYPYTVATTWSLSFKQIKQLNPAAANLLSLCAFLDPDAIPEEFVTEGGPELGPRFSTLAVDALALNKAIETLRTFSLIRRYPTTKILTIHRLVQAVLKEGLKKQVQRRWSELAVRVVNRVFPEVEAETWLKCQRYLPHAQVCAELIEHWNFTFPEAGRLLHQAGHYLSDHAQYPQAEPLLSRALSIREKALGPQHPDTATTLHGLAVLYRLQGRYPQAKPLFLRALEIREQVLGLEHPDTATTLHGLGLLYRFQNVYEEAEKAFLRALAIREKVLGPQHSDTIATIRNLAMNYRFQGKYSQAEPLYQQVLVRTKEKRLDHNHPDTASALNELAVLARFQKNYDVSEKLFQQALAMRKEVLGPKHPDTAVTLNDLSMLYQKQNRFDEAEQMTWEALLIREEVLGQDHPNIAVTLNDLAEIYFHQGKYKEAEPLLLRALAIREKVLGPEQFDTAITLNDLAQLYYVQGKYTESEKLFQRSVAIREKVLGPDKLYVAVALEGLAILYQKQEKYLEAEKLFLRIVKIRKEALGADHPKTLASLNDLASIYHQQGKGEQADDLFSAGQ